MQQATLGGTGLTVSRLALGTLMMGSWGNPDVAECTRIIHRGLDAGINLIDTADVYSIGGSEEIVGRALGGGKRAHVVLTTKCSAPMSDDPNEQGSSRRWIIRACEASLRRLNTDWIDLFQIHRYDPATRLEETLGALSDLVRQGKVRYLGSSTFPAHVIVEAQFLAREHGLERFVCEQPPYSVLSRGIEADVLPVCERFEMGVLPWSPLAGGWLTGRYGSNRPNNASKRATQGDTERGVDFAAVRRWRTGLGLGRRYDMTLPENQAKLRAVDGIAELAAGCGLSVIELALAFVLRHRAVTSCLLGPRTIEHLESQLSAADIELDDDTMNRLDEIVPPGVNLNRADGGWLPPALVSASLRRRPAAVTKTPVG
jgi:aryl-alcohol dehydrogenase-like predicted oxidoreductase